MCNSNILYRAAFLHADAEAQISAINRLMVYVLTKPYENLRNSQKRTAAYEQIDVTCYKSICLNNFKKLMARKREIVEDKVK